MGGAAGGAEALIVDRCAHDQEVAAGETSHPALITYTNLIDSDHMGNLSPPTPGHWRYPNVMCVVCCIVIVQLYLLLRDARDGLCSSGPAASCAACTSSQRQVQRGRANYPCGRTERSAHSPPRACRHRQATEQLLGGTGPSLFTTPSTTVDQSTSARPGPSSRTCVTLAR